jgi:hypothetical protein
MGNSRRKKQGHTGSNNSNLVTNNVKTSCRSEEAAASSMSSESTTDAKEVSSTLVKLTLTSTNKSNNRSNTSSSYISSTTLPHLQAVESGGSGFETRRKDEIDSNNNSKSLLFSWKEILTLCLILVAFAGCSIVVGVAAGVSISIHYYESPENVDRRLMSQWLEGGSVATQHVTGLDPTIVAFSTSFHPSPHHAVPMRVIHTSPNGVRSILNMVEESPTLSKEHSFRNQSNWTFGLGDDEEIFDYEENIPLPPHWGIAIDDWLGNPPKLCPDAKTIGYDSWLKLRLALRDVNRYSAHRFDRWLLYFASLSQKKASRTTSATEYSVTQGSLPFFDDDNLYYEEQFVFTICPGVVLKANSYPLIIDTESVTIECNGCTISGGASHMSFGPEAKNTIVRGITFQHSSRSSVLFHHDGADATFEDCTWIVQGIGRNSGSGRRQIISGLGSIAQVNSSSTVNFYRCSADRPKLTPFPQHIWHNRNP